MDAPYLVGPQFGDVQPKSAAGALSPTVYSVPVPAANDLELGTISRVTPYTAFTEGQDIIFWLDVTNTTEAGGSYINLILLKLWWLRPNVEFRAPGDTNQGGWLGGASTTGTIDGTTFGGATDVNNRGVWIPETRAITIVPPTTPNFMVGFDMHDVIWMIRLQDPATFGLSRRLVFGWKAYGRALGFTGSFTYSGAEQPPVPTVAVSYKTGWAGGSLVSQNAVL